MSATDPILNDTAPEAHEIRLKLLGAKTGAERFAITRKLSSFVLRLSREALKRANPLATEDEIAVRFVEIHYGAKLAADYQRALADHNGA